MDARTIDMMPTPERYLLYLDLEKETLECHDIQSQFFYDTVLSLDRNVLETFRGYVQEGGDYISDQKIVYEDGVIVYWTFNRLTGYGLDIYCCFGLNVTDYYQAMDDNGVLKSVFDQLPYSILWKDLSSNFMGCNRNFAHFAGYNSDKDIIGKTDFDMHWSDRAADFIRDDKLITSTKKPKYTYEESNQLASGGEVLLEVSKMPLVLNSQVRGLVCIFRDITSIRATENRVESALREKESANKMKEEFLRNICHDLRTPLSGIIGETSLLLKKTDDQAVCSSLDDIITAGKNMMTMLNKFIEMHCVVSDSLPMRDDEFLLADVVRQVHKMHVPALKHKDIELVLDTPEEPLYLRLDQGRFSTIIQNLLSNAIKFSKVSGRVIMTWSFQRHTDSSALLKLEVRDEGVGIGKDEIENIFEPFSKVSPSYRNIYQGSGLGLSVVKKFISDLSASIDVQSTVNEGSLFTCKFTLAAVEDASSDETIWTVVSAQQRAEASMNIGSCQGSRILCVEDDAFAMKVQVKTFQELGCKVDTAVCGVDAVARYRQNNYYNFVFMDLGLPDMEALDVIRALRQIERQQGRSSIPIIALTAHLPPDEHVTYLQEGFTYIQIKPLLLDSALRLLTSWDGC